MIEPAAEVADTFPKSGDGHRNPNPALQLPRDGPGVRLVLSRKYEVERLIRLQPRPHGMQPERAWARQLGIPRVVPQDAGLKFGDLLFGRGEPSAQVCQPCAAVS